ncbi:hypothetical protein B9T62_18980 [Paenibacillus donghaensis]|uniref:Uncharacterized protein n=1 Tax=Paenibacillus donghaensis TaxID=414771 RepID=A0A2Z2KQR7_9BACL|nr:hypothetical protein B9T62_18980 [Paenibacillus donghaensis]
MESALLYILFSMIDGLSIFIFAFGSFKVRLRNYWREILLTVLVISIGNYYISTHDSLKDYEPLISITILFLSLILYFRISVFSSLRLTLMGFVGQAVIQGFLIMVTSYVTDIRFNEIKNNDFLRPSLQIISAIILISVTLLLRKLKKHFTTLPNDYTYRIKFTKINNVILLTSACVMLMFINIYNFNNVILEIIFWILCLINIFILETKKEKRDEID